MNHRVSMRGKPCITGILAGLGILLFQDASPAQAAAPVINAGDTAWMLTSMCAGSAGIGQSPILLSDYSLS
jgi:hypothetical protein